MNLPFRLPLLGAALALLAAVGCTTPVTTARRSSLMDYRCPCFSCPPGSGGAWRSPWS